jgi:hypothetical protein
MQSIAEELAPVLMTGRCTVKKLTVLPLYFTTANQLGNRPAGSADERESHGLTPPLASLHSQAE